MRSRVASLACHDGDAMPHDDAQAFAWFQCAAALRLDV